MGVDAQAAPFLALVEPGIAAHLELVILAGRLDRQVAGVRLDGECERAVGPGRGPSSAAGAASRGAYGDEVHRGVRDGPAGAFLGDLAADQDAAGHGQVDGLLGRPLGPLEALRGEEIGLPVGRAGRDRDAAARQAPARNRPSASVSAAV